MYEKVSPINGNPLPLGGKGNDLHTTTACRVDQQAKAQYSGEKHVDATYCEVVHCCYTQENLSKPYRFASLFLTSNLYRITATETVKSTAAAVCNNAMFYPGLRH